MVDDTPESGQPPTRVGTRSAPREPSRDRVAILAFAIAATLAAALILWESRGNTFFNDEIALFQRLAGGVDLETILTPHNGHLIAVANLLYATAFDAIGPDHVFFRLVGVLGVVLCAVLVFVYLRRRVDPLVALAPAVVLLFLGASWEVLLWPLSVATYVFALSAGVAALLLFERDDRVGDIWACVLLVVAVACHSLGLAFVVGVAVSALLRRDRWQLAWVFLIPLGLYVAWWVWALKFDQDSPLTAVNAWLIPGYVADALAVVLGSVTGLSATLSGDSLNPTIALEAGWGRALALAAIVALVVRLVRGKVPAALWATLAILLVFWGSTGLGLGPERSPDQSRYVFPGAVLVFLVAGNAIRGIRLSRTAIAVVLAVAAVAVMTNVRQLHDGDVFLNDYSDRVRTQLAMLELARGGVPPAFDPRAEPDLEDSVPPQLTLQAGPYLEGVDRFGSFAFPIDEVLDQGEETREGADRFLATALGIALRPAPDDADAVGECEELAPPDQGGPATAELAPGASVLRAGAPAIASLGRFSDGYPVSLARIEPGEPVTLLIPQDAGGPPWRLSVAGERPVELCTP